MKELTKTKKGATANLYDVTTANNKLDKPVTSGNPVQLDDVKISNILRESEAMSGAGGAAGISSILPASADSHKYTQLRPTRTPEVRAFGVSSLFVQIEHGIAYV